MPLGRSRCTPLGVEPAFGVFAFLACPSTRHALPLKERRGPKPPSVGLLVLAHGLVLDLVLLRRRAVLSVRERAGLNTATSLARLTTSVMLDVLAVDVTTVLALGATAALGVHSLGLGVDLLGVGTSLRLVVEVFHGLVNAVLFVLDLAASLAVLNMLHRMALNHPMNVVMTHMTLHGQSP